MPLNNHRNHLFDSNTQTLQLDASEYALTHTLEPHYETIKNFSTLKDLQTSTFYAKYGSEIERVINGIAWRNTLPTPAPPKHIRVVAWNIERGLKVDGIIHLIKNNPKLAKADILLMTEADIGMGRTNNRNIPQEIAEALGMNYVFANCFLALEKGDIGEQSHDLPNTLSLHGICIFSKFPIQSYRVVPLPMFRDIFNDLEKRLGCRKGLICTIPIGQHTLDFAVTHLELATSPTQRSLQIQTLLQALTQSTANGILIGGDFNTVTYDLRSKKHLFASLFMKAFLGIHRVIRHALRPDTYFEKSLFDAVEQNGFDYKTCNDLTQGTLYYDINDPIFEAKLKQYHIPNFVFHILRRKLARYNGRIPLRLDWFASKNLNMVTHPTNGYEPPQVMDTPLWQKQPVSDHSPIVVDLEI